MYIYIYIICHNKIRNNESTHTLILPLKQNTPIVHYLFFIWNLMQSFSGIKHEWQVNGLDDIQDRSTLAEKLGGNVVVSLEGRSL